MVFALPLWVIVSALVSTVVWVLFKLFIVVPPRNVAIVERLGLFSRVLWPGFHFVWWPAEILRTVRWTYPKQDGSLRRTSHNFIPFDNAQMDIPPLDCITRDQIRVEVDATLMYTITKPQAAVYETDDILNMFYQCTNQALRNIIANMTAAEMQGHDSEIGKRVADYVNTTMTAEKGVRCNSFMIQSMVIDEAIRKANQDIYAKQRQQQMHSDAEAAQHERTMAAHARAKAAESETAALSIQERNTSIRLAQMTAEADADRRLIESKSRADAKALEWRSILNAGFSMDQVVELKRIDAQREAQCAIAASDNKIIYAPSDFWAAPRTAAFVHQEQRGDE